MGEINWGGLTRGEDFEGVDGTDLDVYDAAWTVTHDVGTETVEIDDAQAPGGGSTSALIYYDGINAPLAQLDIVVAETDYVRISCSVRVAQVNGRSYFRYQNGGSIKARWNFHSDSKIKISYGDGAAGNNTVEVAYAANTDYEVWADFDFTNNKWRMWIDGVMYPGPNADAQGFDNMDNDSTTPEINRLYLFSITAAGSFWIDDLNYYTGWVQTNYLGSTPDPKGLPLALPTPTPTPGGA